MKLKLLLDENFDPEIAAALRRRFPGLDVQHIRDWLCGGCLSALDPTLLEILDADERTLVSWDTNSLPRHILDRLNAGLTHGGVILAHSKTVKQTDRKAIVRRLRKIVEQHGHEDWCCRHVWL